MPWLLLLTAFAAALPLDRKNFNTATIEEIREELRTTWIDEPAIAQVLQHVRKSPCTSYSQLANDLPQLSRAILGFYANMPINGGGFECRTPAMEAAFTAANWQIRHFGEGKDFSVQEFVRFYMNFNGLLMAAEMGAPNEAEAQRSAVSLYTEMRSTVWDIDLPAPPPRYAAEADCFYDTKVTLPLGITRRYEWKDFIGSMQWSDSPEVLPSSPYVDLPALGEVRWDMANGSIQITSKGGVCNRGPMTESVRKEGLRVRIQFRRDYPIESWRVWGEFYTVVAGTKVPWQP